MEEFRLTCCKSLDVLTTAQVVATFEKVEVGRAAQILESFSVGASIGYAIAGAWNCNVAFRVEEDLVNAIVESAMGGDRTKPAQEDHPPSSRIGEKLVHVMMEQFVKTLGTVFAPINDPDLRLAKISRRRDAAAFGSEKSVLLVLNYRLESLYRGGRIQVIIPQAPLLPLQSILSKLPSTMRQMPDTDWKSQMAERVQGAQVRLDAVLDCKAMTLQEVVGFKVGQMIELGTGPGGRVEVECGGRALFQCALGQADGTFTLKVEKRAVPEDTLAATLDGHLHRIHDEVVE